MIVQEWIFILFLGLLNGVFTVYFVKRAENGLADTLNGLNDQLRVGIEELNTQLEPLHNAVSRSMGVISHLGDETKMDKALERRIGQDMMDQAVGEYGDILELVKASFPRVAEYIEEKPEAITKLLPRLEKLINDPEARKRLSFPSPSSRTHQPHPFGNEER